MTDRILLPIKTYEQGKFAVETILNNKEENASEIRLLHCIENKLGRPSFFSATEAIRLADEQSDRVDDSQHFLEELGKRLVDSLQDVRISVKSTLVDTVHEGILDEAEIMKATKIMIVTEPERKLRWFGPEISTRIMSNAKIPVHIIKPAMRKGTHNSPRVA